MKITFKAQTKTIGDGGYPTFVKSHTPALPAWDEEQYRKVATPGSDYLEGQWGTVPTGLFSQLTGKIIEIYPNGSYLFNVQLDDPSEVDEILVTDSDVRLFEVDLPPWA